jgi:hypothetical protein
MATSTASWVETVSANRIGGIELAERGELQPDQLESPVGQSAEHQHAHEQAAQPGQIGDP